MIRAGAEELPLTSRELSIAALLASADGRIVARDEILETVWGDATEGAGASLEVLVTRVRRKLAAVGAEGAIRTVRHVGYTWDLARSKPT